MPDDTYPYILGGITSMETVWITLSTVVEGNDSPESRTFMFGPTGITGFKTITFGHTVLLTGNKAIAIVENSQTQIMGILRKMRNTGREYGKNVTSKKEKTSGSKSSAPKNKVPR